MELDKKYNRKAYPVNLVANCIDRKDQSSEIVQAKEALAWCQKYGNVSYTETR